MSYSLKLFEEAQKIIDKRRQKAIFNHQLRQKEIYQLIPQIKQLDQTISQTSIDVAKEILSSQANLKDIINGLMIKNISLQEERKKLLIKNNYPQDYLDINYYCSQCDDTGYLKDGVCNCLKKLLKEKAYQQLNMEVNLNKFKFSTFKIDYYPNDYVASDKSLKTPREIAAYNLQYCENFVYKISHQPDNILMQGGTGLGKTHLSLAIAGRCIENELGVIYVSAQQLLHKLESDKFGKKQEGFLDSIINSDLLIIDDLGTEFCNQFIISEFYHIINSRLLEHHSTIINTNLSMYEMLDKYSARMVSRIFGNYNILTFYGKDLRVSHNNNNNTLMSHDNIYK